MVMPRKTKASPARDLVSGLSPEELGHPVAAAVGLDQPVVAQHRHPGIPVPAARFLAEAGRELVGIYVALASSCEGAQHLGRRRRQAITPHGQPLGRCRRRRRHLTGGFQPLRRCCDQTIPLGNVLSVSQLFAPGVEMPDGAGFRLYTNRMNQEQKPSSVGGGYESNDVF
jgi:hypothetical protein